MTLGLFGTGPGGNRGRAAALGHARKPHLALGEKFFHAGLSSLVVGNRDVEDEVGSFPNVLFDAVSVVGGRGRGGASRRGGTFGGGGAAEGSTFDLLESCDRDNSGAGAWGVRSGDRDAARVGCDCGAGVGEAGVFGEDIGAGGCLEHWWG